MPVGLFDIEMSDVVKMFVCDQKIIWICCRGGCKIISDQNDWDLLEKLQNPVTLIVLPHWCAAQALQVQSLHFFDNNLITIFIILTIIWSRYS